MKVLQTIEKCLNMRDISWEYASGYDVESHEFTLLIRPTPKDMLPHTLTTFQVSAFSPITGFLRGTSMILDIKNHYSSRSPIDDGADLKLVSDVLRRTQQPLSVSDGQAIKVTLKHTMENYSAYRQLQDLHRDGKVSYNMFVILDHFTHLDSWQAKGYTDIQNDLYLLGKDMVGIGEYSDAIELLIREGLFKVNKNGDYKLVLEG